MTSTSPACPDTGAWRAWLDHEDQLTSTDQALDQHLAVCGTCRDLMAELREDAAGARAAFSVLAPIRLPSAAETAAAYERLTVRRTQREPLKPLTHLENQEPIPMVLTRKSNSWTSWQVAASGVAAVLALSLLVAFTPQGNAAAAAFLAQFRSQQVVGVEVTPQSQADLVRTMNALGNLGTVQSPNGLLRGGAREATPTTVSAADASKTIGFPILLPDPTTLPAGIDKTPRVQVMPASQIRFTFDKAKARTYYQSTGHPEVSMPDKFDGATLVVSIPATALLQYGNPSSRDALIVAEAGELVVDVEGGKVSLPEMRDFLLGLPGLPASTVSQLKQIQNWNETLPIPIPVDKVNWQSTSFSGNQGLLLNDNSGVGSAAIWHANGHLFGVAGSLRATDLRPIADGLGSGH